VKKLSTFSIAEVNKMSLLDSVMGAIGGKNPMGGNLEQLASQLGNGGLDSIVGKLQQGGLGNVIQSWIGTGANLPVSADQLTSALGSEQVSKLTSALGINASSLASVLPGLIDQLTPQGKLPEGGALNDLVSNAMSSGALTKILGGFLK
jgi:uncharacterized protein YidB (DUF937 family)